MAMIYDAVIVGGGPAGGFLSWRLARAGQKVLLLERHKKIPRKVCGEYLCPRGVNLLRPAFGEDLEKLTLPVLGMTVFTASGQEVRTRFPEGQIGWSINRKTLDTFLLERAEQAGARVILGSNVTDIQPNGDLFEVICGDQAFITRQVVGADGRGSRVSKLFLNDMENEARRLAAHAIVPALKANARFGEMHLFADGSYIGVNPVGEFECNLSLVSDADRIQDLGGLKRALSHFIARSKSLSQRFAANIDAAAVTAAFPIEHRTRSLTPAHKIYLIGDAAGFVDPLTGEGIFNALFSADLLASALIESPVHADKMYSKSYVKHLSGKRRLNRFFQWLIRHPNSVKRVADFLLRNPRRADTFIGIVGNVYTPGVGLFKLLR